MTYAWVDSTQHFLLVDDNGAPLISDDCPCGSSTICWQRYEASCVDYNGSPVYGDSGTGNISEAHWDAPIMTDWSCARTLPNAGVTNAWVQDSPGFAHLWIKTELAKDVPRSDCPARCSVPTEVPKPDLPCSCLPIWSNVNHPVTAPNYSYIVRKWKFIGWDVGPNGSTMVESAILPIWQYSSFASRFDKVTGSRYSSTKSWYYLGNYVTGSLDGHQSFCGESSAEKAAYKSFQDHGSYAVYSVRSTTASGAYVRLPNESIWGHRSGSDAWIEDERIFVVSSLYKDPETGETVTSCCVSELEGVELNTYWTNYSRVHELPFYTSFNSEQWGHFSVDVTPSDPHLHPFVVREARGAQVPRDEIDLDVTQFVTGRYEGSPLWYYRTYVTTDWDLSQLNWDNWEFALSGIGQNISSKTGYITAPGVFCPQYWFLYITEAWQACVDDTDPRALPFIGDTEGAPCEPGVPCAAPTYKLSVAPDGRYNPPPYWTSYENTETAWKHEVDESLDQNDDPQDVPGLRSMNSQTDEHAYKVSRLTIKNYPTWYGSDVKCANVLDGAAWEIPQMDLTDAAWFRRRGCYGIPEKREWPDVLDSRTTTSCTCAFTRIDDVAPIETLVLDRPASWYYKTIGFQQNFRLQSDGGWRMPLDYVVGVGEGCPNNWWSAVMYWTVETDNECCVTSGGVSEWVLTPGSKLLYVSTGYVGSDGRGDWSMPTGTFTWQGNVPNSSIYCPGYVSPDPVIFSMGDGEEEILDSNASHIVRYSHSEPQAWIFEIARSPCDAASCPENISTIAKYAIRYNAEIIDKNHCPNCDILHDGDVLSVIVSCSAGYTKTLKYVEEETWQHASVIGELILPGMVRIGPISEGFADADYALTRTLTVGYSEEWTGEATITWHTGMDAVFDVPLTNVYNTKTWITDIDDNIEYTYNLTENTFSEVVQWPDSPPVTYVSGGRIYTGDAMSSMFAHGSPVVLVSQGFGSTATISKVTSDDGTCEFRVAAPAFTFNEYLNDVWGPGLPMTDSPLDFSSAWQPGFNNYMMSSAIVWHSSVYADSNGSDGNPKSWTSNNGQIAGSLAMSAYSYGDYLFPSLADMDRDYSWEYRPELLNPCDYAGIDVLDSAPTLVVSTQTEYGTDYALSSAYNSGSCYGSWQRTTYPGTGVTRFVGGSWVWQTEANYSAVLNPDNLLP